MLALCRLAKEQGVLVGDLHELQQLALLAVMAEDSGLEKDKAWNQFKMMSIAMHPEHATELMDAFEKGEDVEIYDEPTGPLSMEEKEKILKDLMSIGFSAS